jgi:hypothetical protein
LIFQNGAVLNSQVKKNHPKTGGSKTAIMGAPQGGELYRCDRRFVNVVAAISLSFFLGLGVGGLFSAQSNNQWRETVGLNLALVPERKAALQAPPPGDRDCSLPQPVRVWVREVPNSSRWILTRTELVISTTSTSLN